MSVRSFHSVFMASAVAGAALGCYLVSLRVASERAALESVESTIVATQADIHLLQTEIGTRGRLAQLERWNVRVLALSAPSADQILGDKFQLAKLVRPEHRLDVEGPVILASAPAPQASQPFAQDSDPDVQAAPVAQLLHEASVKLPDHEVIPVTHVQAKPAPSMPVQAKAQAPARRVTAKPIAVASAEVKKAGDKKAKPATDPVTRPVRTAKIDPLAPLPSERSTGKATRTNR